MEITLPEKYQEKMKNLLGEEYEAYLSSFHEEHYTALRVNTSKISVAEFKQKFPYPLEPIPWCENGFYTRKEDPVSKHPYYHAGLYYIQEPSAMLPAASLPVEPGDVVADLCAAPGGKSTELGVKLKGQGTLLSNDISVSRARALLKNIEHFGLPNAYVTAEDPKKLLKNFAGTFDKILVDAPCSGEGMFRKDHSLITSWLEKDGSYYAPIQKEILSCAIEMLKDGGMLVYSTCTFSKEEDEDVIAYALEKYPECHILPIKQCEGFVQNEYGTKLFPHHIKGEGHFVTLIQKGTAEAGKTKPAKQKGLDIENIRVPFVSETAVYQDKMYALPPVVLNTAGLRVLRSGVLLGENKKKRFEIDPTLAMYLKDTDCKAAVHLAKDDVRVQKYLKGETISLHDFDVKDGNVLVCVEEYSLGFGKLCNGILKNKYPKAWLVK